MSNTNYTAPFLYIDGEFIEGGDRPRQDIVNPANGQVIGSTNRFGEEPDERPIDYKDVFVTMYHNMGIDIVNTPVPEMNGRPNYLYAGHEPIRELV